MSRLTTRVDRLVRRSADRQQGARCSLCRSWPNVRVLEIDIYGTETLVDPTIPERCAACGWSPTVVRIIEVRDWERVGKHGVR